jgi:hypothetical protein
MADSGEPVASGSQQQPPSDPSDDEEPVAGPSGESEPRRKVPRPPPEGTNYRALQGRQQRSLIYQTFTGTGDLEGVTWQFDKAKKSKPGEKKVWYMRCSDRSASRCMARASIIDNELIPNRDGPGHSCLTKYEGAPEMQIELEVKLARSRMMQRAIDTNESALVRCALA